VGREHAGCGALVHTAGALLHRNHSVQPPARSRMVLALPARWRQGVRAFLQALAARVVGTSPSRVSSASASEAVQQKNATG
jgi:hypothetical protein